MDKTVLHRLAVKARHELIAQVTCRVKELEYQDHATIRQLNAWIVSSEQNDSAATVTMSLKERQRLATAIKEKGVATFSEDIACGWFIRLIALRFMEANDYLSSPQLFSAELSPEANHRNCLQYCQQLHQGLPKLFLPTGDFTEWLLPISIFQAGGFVHRLVTDIPETAWQDHIEMISWLYQYYVSERRDEIIHINKGVIKKQDIPAATQVFTPYWVVRYLVDNSLGRYWIERNPASRLVQQLTYYVSSPSAVGEYLQVSSAIKE
ncbi:MAG TPA: hypothetical protein GX717_05730, partial [Clostridiaceae bacterium]|nr:hypothetical protein [Clostridiaceae bacterium]